MPRLAIARLTRRARAGLGGAIASRLAELVRGDFEGRLIRPFVPEARLRHEGAPSPQGEKGRCGPHWGYTRPSAGLLALLLAILGTSGAAACEVPEGFARLASAEAEIAYRWEPAELKVGRFFAAEVVACRAPDPTPVRAIVLDAQMPAHGHGMNYRPAVAETGPGRFRVTGLLLHMAGTWRLTFDLLQGDRRTRLTREIILKP